jgi:hypothetical protein
MDDRDFTSGVDDGGCLREVCHTFLHCWTGPKRPYEYALTVHVHGNAVALIHGQMQEKVR